jgi:hypothetical protein
VTAALNAVTKSSPNAPRATVMSRIDPNATVRNALIDATFLYWQ